MVKESSCRKKMLQLCRTAKLTNRAWAEMIIFANYGQKFIIVWLFPSIAIDFKLQISTCFLGIRWGFHWDILLASNNSLVLVNLYEYCKTFCSFKGNGLVWKGPSPHVFYRFQQYINLLYPSISMNTVLHTFPELLTRKISWTIKSSFRWWSFPLLPSFDFDVWFRGDIVRRS